MSTTASKKVKGGRVRRGKSGNLVLEKVMLPASDRV